VQSRGVNESVSPKLNDETNDRPPARNGGWLQKIHSCTADRLAVNERPSIHERFRVNGIQKRITGCTGKPEMRSAMTSSALCSTPFIQPPGTNWVSGTSYPASLIFSCRKRIDRLAEARFRLDSSRKRIRARNCIRNCIAPFLRIRRSAGDSSAEFEHSETTTKLQVFR